MKIQKIINILETLNETFLANHTITKINPYTDDFSDKEHIILTIIISSKQKIPSSFTANNIDIDIMERHSNTATLKITQNQSPEMKNIRLLSIQGSIDDAISNLEYTRRTLSLSAKGIKELLENN